VKPTEPPRCSCGKVIHGSEVAARLVAAKQVTRQGVYLDVYWCRTDPLGGWHVTNIEKRLESHGNDEHLVREHDRLSAIKGVAQAANQKETKLKKLAESERALVLALRKLPSSRPSAETVKRRRKQPVRRKRRYRQLGDETRCDYPRGETAAGMLGRWTGKNDLAPGEARQIRRRNRAREDEAVRKQVADDLKTPTWREQRDFQLNDEYRPMDTQTWRALGENDEGLRFVDFDGSYTIEGEGV
jgi:hypothetical protein